MKNSKIKIIKSIVCTTIIFLVIVALYIGLSNYAKKYYKQPELEDWVITVNDYAPYTASLYDDVYKGFGYGDKITLQKMITLDEEVSAPVIRYFSRHFAEEIYINNELVYEKGLEDIQEGKVVGNHYAQAKIKTDKDYCYVTIVLTVGNYSSKALPYVYVEDGFEVMEHFNIDVFINLIIAAIMIVIGVTLIFIMIINGGLKKEYIKGLWVGFFALCVAGWTMCNYCILQLVVDNQYITYLITETALFMMPIPMMLFIIEYQKEGLKKKIEQVLVIMLTVFDVLTFILEIAGIYSYTYFVPIYQLLTTICIVYTMFMIISGVKENIDNMYLLVGVTYFGISCLYDLGRSYINTSEEVFNFTQSIVPIGAFMFFVSMVVFYGNDVARVLYSSAEQKTLFQLAYTDSLTHIANRAKCEEYAKVVDEDTSNTYSVISLDLNGLKYVNDTFGHMDGDKFIVGFVDVLKEVFGNEEDAFIGRMGGDEFLIILKNCVPQKILSLINQMNTKLNEANANGNKYVFSAAYGVAIRGTNDQRKIWKVYEEADEKMYACKKYQREKMGIRVRE